MDQTLTVPKKQPCVTMTRRVTFSAVHFDASEPTVMIGHNYVLNVAVRGQVSPITGMVLNIKEIDRIVREEATSRFHNRLLNDLAEFADGTVTYEKLLLVLKKAVSSGLPEGVWLSDISLQSDEHTTSVWSMKEPQILETTRTYEFAASHRLHSPHLSEEENQSLFGKCNNLKGHGHNYVLEITVAGVIDAISGRVVDPNELDEIVNREVVERYDHKHLNEDIVEFAALVPSTEVLTKTIWDRLVNKLPDGVQLKQVLVRETARNSFAYNGEEN